MNEQEQTKQISISHLSKQLKFWVKYLLSKWLVIGITVLLGMIIGIVYCWIQKPIYKAELSFTPEESKGTMGSYMSIAAQFGFDLGGSGGGVFEGDNIIELFKSNSLIHKTLFDTDDYGGKKQTLISYRISSLNKNNKKLSSFLLLNKIDLNNKELADQHNNRVYDSVVLSVVKTVKLGLNVDRRDKKLNIINVSYVDDDEFFAKVFVEKLAMTAIKYYQSYKSSKARQNVEILQHQADSVKGMLFGGMSDIAQLNDVNINPLRQAPRVGVQKKNVDVQVNGVLYSEILKNLELSKIALRKETPFIQIIDTPILPLEKKKMGRMLGGIIGGFLAGIFVVIALVFKKSFV